MKALEGKKTSASRYAMGTLGGSLAYNMFTAFIQAQYEFMQDGTFVATITEPARQIEEVGTWSISNSGLALNIYTRYEDSMLGIIPSTPGINYLPFDIAGGELIIRVQEEESTVTVVFRR